MIKQEEMNEISGLFAESLDETGTKLLPVHIIFAEKIIIREVDRAAKAVCFMCNEGNNPTIQGNTSQWVHVFHRSSGFTYVESCRAHVIRARKISV